MHMADALISPVAGGVMWAAAAGVSLHSIQKIRKDLDETKIPLMGVMGAFVFAAQMINFSIPGTGSSGHLGGGLLLAVLLGPHAGFLTMASILIIQALFFADGGLLALGCNIFNLGFFTCFVAYPFLFKQITRKGWTASRIFAASLISGIASLQLGAFSVVIETFLSGKTEIPFNTFLLLMQPIHLVIGIVEGAVTAAVVTFIWKERPEIVEYAAEGKPLGRASIKKVLCILIIAAFLLGGIFSWFASTSPDGLEWSLFKSSGKEELETPKGIHEALSNIQEKTALMPDYGFKKENPKFHEEDNKEVWPAVESGTSVSGILGGMMTLLLAVFTGGIIVFIKKRKRTTEAI
ncbi:MAG: energy-coupling factor ABC transporter permease [Clostridia bacterium]|nr:energy-coupling factor ABC transporter permease [Clostridia bacterium]